MAVARSCLSLLLAGSLTGVAGSAAAKPSASPKVTPAGAAEARAGAEAAAAGDGDALAKSAAELGDPLLFIAAGKAILAQAETPDEAAEAREPAWAALDILHFIKSGGADARWQVIAAGDAAGHITSAESLLQEVDSTIERMEEEARAAEEAARVASTSEEKAPKRERKPGTGLIAAGSALTVVGVGGLGMIGAGLGIGASTQSDVESVDPNDQAAVDRLDKAGFRANIIAYAGIGVAAVGLGVGVALLAVGVKKRKAGGGNEVSFLVAPAPGGLVLSGRF